ncbi:hypothetical protein JRO89_XS09G0158600 [Xanthoceras sorbifolium]|uniref:Uncharacterized protein n=1 Tax=Xanthoceras sorbifolium TaxID=99658 RepID=A0ABQ8HLR1_9ROSI|nr:hypothetical protein JRO89_XS09G0158600 [Xanthoceras sorbifolium]
MEQIVIIEKILRLMTSRFDYVAGCETRNNTKMAIMRKESIKLRVNGTSQGDDEELQELEAENVHGGEEQVDNGAAGSGSSSSEEAENNPSSPVQGRVKRAPTWMEDYVRGNQTAVRNRYSPTLPTESKSLNQNVHIINGAVVSFSSWSRVVSTKRTILSPFTKEYRVLATFSGIHQFLEELYLEYDPNQI